VAAAAAAVEARVSTETAAKTAAVVEAKVAAEATAKRAEKVGPARNRSPRHPPHLDPRLLSQLASRDVASVTCQALGEGGQGAEEARG